MANARERGFARIYRAEIGLPGGHDHQRVKREIMRYAEA
jgi:hypothetical protein